MIDKLINLRKFDVGWIYIDNKKVETKEIVVIFPKQYNDKNQAMNLFNKLINSLNDIGAIRIEPEISDWNIDNPETGKFDILLGFSGYFRYFPGNPKDFINAKLEI